MFETTKIIILNSKRDLIKKFKETPVLYFFFALIMIFSILMFSFLAFYLQIIDTPLEINLSEIFFLIFFVFIAKSGVDMFKYFVKPGEITYVLSTQLKQNKTIAEIFFSVLLTNLFIWFSLSTLFLLFLMIFPIDIYYPLEYLYVNIIVISAIFIGSTICLTFFSDIRIRLVPTIVLLLAIFVSQKPLFIVFTTPLSLLHLIWSLKYSLSSYQNIRRKTRTKDKAQIKVRNKIKAIFYKETIILWRDKLFLSFVSTSAVTGFLTGYLYLYGPELLVPESLREIYAGFLPALFVLMGVIIVVIYTSVFPSLNLFLNEEKTMWIIRHNPIESKTLIFGKTSTLLLCFITTIPFISFVIIFIEMENLLFITWLLIFSYIISAAISIPLGVKYVGKKSDVMLLYSVTIILFLLLSPFAIIGGYIWQNFSYPGFFLSLFILISFLVLYLSLKLSEKIIVLKYPNSSFE
jgi:hypothetical protein